MRSRLRSASVRGFRAAVERFFVISKILATGGCLRLSTLSEAVSVLVEAAAFRQSWLESDQGGAYACICYRCYGIHRFRRRERTRRRGPSRSRNGAVGRGRKVA